MELITFSGFSPLSIWLLVHLLHIALYNIISILHLSLHSWPDASREQVLLWQSLCSLGAFLSPDFRGFPGTSTIFRDVPLGPGWWITTSLSLFASVDPVVVGRKKTVVCLSPEYGGSWLCPSPEYGGSW